MGWLSGWSYRRKVTITEKSGNNLTDYQIKVELNSSNFDFSKAKSDGSDIRFTDSDGVTLLSYWIESWDSTNEEAIIWVKVPSIPASNSAYIYMYYGNSSAEDASSGSDTFQIFDDFEDGSTSGWSSSNSYTTFSISTDAGYNSAHGLNVHVDNSGSYDLKRSIGGQKLGYIRFSLKHLNYAQDDIDTVLRDSNGNVIAGLNWRRAKSSDPCHTYISVFGDCSNHKRISLNVWYEVVIKIDYSSSTFDLYIYDDNGLFAEWKNVSTDYPNPIDNIAFRMLGWYDISGDPYWNFHFDRLIMGNWVSPEPTYTIGSEGVPSPPSAPQNLVATGKSDGIHLSWAPPSTGAVEGYKIYRGTNSGGEEYLATTANTTYIDTTASPHTIYYYYVVAYNSAGDSDPSDEVSAELPPDPPSNLVVEACQSGGGMKISWSYPQNIQGMSKFYIYRDDVKIGVVNYVPSQSNYSYLDTGLTIKTEYTYKVVAVDEFGTLSENNPTASQIYYEIPEAPSDIAVVDVGEDYIKVDWANGNDSNNNPDNIEGYYLYYDTVSGGEAHKITLANLPYTIMGLDRGATYFIHIRAYNICSESAPSNEVSATTTGPPSVPENITIILTSAGLKLSWDAANGNGSAIIQYNIYRATESGNEGTEPYATVDGSTLEYLDTNVNKGQIYYYQISAVNAKGEGERSEEIAKRFVLVPSSPKNLVGIPGDKKAILIWGEPDDDGGYCEYGIMYREADGNYQLAADGIKNTVASLSNLTNGVKYYFKVYAYNEAGKSGYSNEVVVIPTSAPEEVLPKYLRKVVRLLNAIRIHSR